jgi:hypothetical protein
MKTGFYARLLFGASAVLFGVIALKWYDVDTWQTLHQIWSLPFGAAIGACFMMGQVAGGIGIQYPGTARLGSIVLVIVYLFFSLALVPEIVAGPLVYWHYGSFFEQFPLLCGAIALYTATEPNRARAASLGRVARLGLGVSAISFALSQIFYFRLTAQLVPKWIPPNQTCWAMLTTVAFALAAIAILVNRYSRLAMHLLALMLALFGVLVWVPSLIAHPENHRNWSEFALNFLITGAVWTVAEFAA